MTITIIVPIYNVEKYIKRCINSIINQKYNGNIECLLINDCTPDSSIIIAQQIIKEYKGNITFKIINHLKNKGLSSARNTGIKAATGEYIYFLDSDDYITDNCIQTLSNIINKYNHPDLVQSNFSIEQNNQVHASAFFTESITYYSDDRFQIKKLLLDTHHFPMMAWNRLINRDFLIKNNLYFTEGIFYEDGLWTYFLAKAVRTLYINSSPTYIYLIREDSIMNNRNSCNIKIKSAIFILHEFINNIDNQYPFLQKQFIFNKLKEEYIYKENKEYRKMLIIENKYFSQCCNYVGKILLLILRITPIFLLKKKPIYISILTKLAQYIK